MYLSMYVSIYLYIYMYLHTPAVRGVRPERALEKGGVREDFARVVPHRHPPHLIWYLEFRKLAGGSGG